MVYEKVTTVEPWSHQGGRTGAFKCPSTCYTLLLKLFLLKLTEPQVQELLDHPDSPFIRAVGVLYVRFGAPPRKIWKWLGPLVDDVEDITPGLQSSLDSFKFGEWCRKLMLDPTTYDIMLPPLGDFTEKRIAQRLVQFKSVAARAQRNLVALKEKRLELKVATVPNLFELTGDFDLVSEPIVFVSMRSIRNLYRI